MLNAALYGATCCTVQGACHLRPRARPVAWKEISMFSMEWFRLDNQHAFVTGAGSGIGQGIAIGLAQAGAQVTCFDLPSSSGLADTCLLYTSRCV